MDLEYRDSTAIMLESLTDDLDNATEGFESFKNHIRSTYPDIEKMKGIVCGIADFRLTHARNSMFEDSPLKKGVYDYKVKVADIIANTASTYLEICPK